VLAQETQQRSAYNNKPSERCHKNIHNISTSEENTKIFITQNTKVDGKPVKNVFA